MARDVRTQRVHVPAHGIDKQRFRIINENFAALVDAIERLKLTNGLIVEADISHGVLADLGEDDHTQYQLRSEKGAASGYASLDSNTVVVERVSLVQKDTLANRPGTGTDGQLFVATDVDEIYIWHD